MWLFDLLLLIKLNSNKLKKNDHTLKDIQSALPKRQGEAVKVLMMCCYTENDHTVIVIHLSERTVVKEVHSSNSHIVFYLAIFWSKPGRRPGCSRTVTASLRPDRKSARSNPSADPPTTRVRPREWGWTGDRSKGILRWWSINLRCFFSVEMLVDLVRQYSLSPGMPRYWGLLSGGFFSHPYLHLKHKLGKPLRF